MLIRADIDRQDLTNVRRDTRRLLSRKTVSLALTASLLLLVFSVAGAGVYFSIEAVMGSAAPQGGEIANLYQEQQTSLINAGLGVAVMLLCAAAGYGVYQSRRDLGAAGSQGAIKDGLTTGRFEYLFSDKHLTIKGPIKIEKIAWTAFVGIEDAKSSIVFWREDGGFEFIPKNVLPESVTFERLQSDYLPNIEQALPYEEALHVKQLSVTFELLASDRDEYFSHYFQRLDGRLSFIRRIFRWPALPVFAFSISVLIAGLNFYAALRAGDPGLAGTGAAFALFAGGLFFLKPEYFRGPAYPFQKKEPWPFAQSNLTSVTLSKDAVFWRDRGVQRVIRWDGIEELVECPLTAYLVLTPTWVIALPKRAFICASHYHFFTGFANSRIAAARRAREERKQRRLTRSFARPAAVPAAEIERFPTAANTVDAPGETAPDEAAARNTPMQNTVVRLRAV